MPITITFLPLRQSVSMPAGISILEAAAQAGIALDIPCGGAGKCGKCRVKVISGTVTLGDASRAALSGAQLQKGFRLACQEKIDADAAIEIPAESMLAGSSAAKILTASGTATTPLKPRVRKLYFELPHPDRDSPDADQTRFRKAVGPCEFPPALMRRMPGFLRDHGFSGTVVLWGSRCVAFEPGDTTRRVYGMAFDIGTTTIVGMLVDLITGKDLALGSRLNPQVKYGDDVISRISLVRQDLGNLQLLQQASVTALNEIIDECIAKASIVSHDIWEIGVAGNSIMQQIFCGIDPSPLGEIPFIAAFENGQSFAAADIGLRVNPAAYAFCLPQIGGFVGGDTVAGIIATRLDTTVKPTLLVDIGTNCEIVLSHQGKMLATSTAAGPAFEGARISQGMRATVGAIEKIHLRNNDIAAGVIGNVPPVGLCGSALIDAAATLLNLGVLDMMGRILTGDELPAGLSPAIRRRVIMDNDQPAVVLAFAESTGALRSVLVRQCDIRQLQLGVGAIRAGISILLRRTGLTPESLDTVLLAGAFGNYIRRHNAVRIGLLPQVPVERIRFISNSSAMGARLALVSTDEREYAEQVIRSTTHIDLSLDQQFQEEFAMAMIFPE